VDFFLGNPKTALCNKKQQLCKTNDRSKTFPIPSTVPYSRQRCLSSSPPRNRLAEGLAVGKLPDGAGESIAIRDGIEVHVLESLWDGRAILRVVAHLDELRGVDVLVVDGIVGVDLNGDLGWEVELAVEGASAVARLDGGRGAELVHPGGAGAGAVKAGLDAVALVLDLWKGQVDFGDDTGDVEAFDIWVGAFVSMKVWSGCKVLSGVLTADAALVGDLEVGADAGLGRVTVANSEGPG